MSQGCRPGPGSGVFGFPFQPLRIGGGGFVTGFDITADGTRVCRCDSFGAYIWNPGTSKWDQLCTTTRLPAATQTLLSAHGVFELRIAPSNTNVLYMHYGQGNGNGNPWAFVSINKGQTWVQLTGWTLVAGDPTI